jgi:hypothetical protein
MSVRAAEERRRRRARREERVRLRREFVVGGPLVDLAAPIIGGGDRDHAWRVQVEIRRRALAVQAEADLLAEDFAKRCWLPWAAYLTMVLSYVNLMSRVGPPGVLPTHSTDIRTPTSNGTIPRL